MTAQSEAMGAIVVNEYILPITSIRLRDGAFEIRATVQGPVPAVSSKNYTVHDDQGAVVYRSDGEHEIQWCDLNSGSQLVLFVILSVVGKQSERIGWVTRAFNG